MREKIIFRAKIMSQKRIFKMKIIANKNKINWNNNQNQDNWKKFLVKFRGRNQKTIQKNYQIEIIKSHKYRQNVMTNYKMLKEVLN